MNHINVPLYFNLSNLEILRKYSSSSLVRYVYDTSIKCIHKILTGSQNTYYSQSVVSVVSL